MGSGILFNAARMKEIEDGTVTSGLVDVNGDLILTRHDETQVNAGHVRGEDGTDGTDGANGLSAYEVWLADGNTGTEEDFLEAIKGADGEIGIPAGSIMAWGATGIPTNWLECNGQAVDRELYSDLFAIIGAKYGAGDGSTTFNVPDLRGRAIVGLDSSDSDFDDFGKTGGEKEHQLTVDEMPSHTHIQDSHAHDPRVAVTYGGNASTYRSIFATNSSFWGWDSNNRMSSTTATNQNTGGDEAHNNLQPFGVAKYIIKASGGIDSLSSTVETVLLGRVADVEQWQGEVQAISGTNRPSFQATGTNTVSKSGAQSYTTLVLGVERFDQTGDYDASTGLFTAPVDGVYMFAISMTQTGTATGPEIGLFKNGSMLYGNLGIGYGVAYQTFGSTVVAKLEAGDVIDIRWQNNNGATVTIDRTRSQFGGALLG